MWAKAHLVGGFAALLLLLATEAGASGDPLAERIERQLAERRSSIAVRLARLERSTDKIVIGLVIDDSVDLTDLPAEIENVFETAAGAAAALYPEVPRIDFEVAHPGNALAPPPRRARTKSPAPERLESIMPDLGRFPFGQALRGKTIAISPGHGYIYYDSLGDYSTQRANTKWNGCGSCRGIVEDFGTHEIVVRYLIPLLEGAGARVVLVRDRSYESEGVIVDDGSPGYREISGSFMDGSTSGGNDGDYRASVSADAQAEWTLNAPATGSQLLSLWFVPGANRRSDATVEVEGPNGSRRYIADFRTHGYRWAPIDLFDVSAGAPLTVRLIAPGTGADALIADAVRLGAGKHSSGHAWWSMGANPFATYQSAPSSVSTLGDVTVRPAYAEWYGADAYVSIHSNAAGQTNSTAAGSVTYRFNCLQYPDHSNDPDPSACDDPVGSDRLQEIVHREMMGQIQQWDSAWTDRGTKVANFGELRGLDSIPGILIETAFHDNVELPSGHRMTDNQALHDPRFRRLLAEGIYRGLAEFLGSTAPPLPAPPSGLAIRRVDDHSIELDFDPVVGADGYRVYVAQADRFFDDGRIFESPPFRIDNLRPETATFVKVASLNAAGEGLSSRTLAARPSLRPAQVLIVDAFDREDAWVQAVDNRKNTAMVHGLALANSPVSFDGADEVALRSGRVRFEDYEAVVLALGREASEHGILDEGLRGQLWTFSGAGGAVFADGSEIGWVLDTQGDATSQSFIRSVFGASLASDDAAGTAVGPAAGGWMADEGVGASLPLDDGTGGGLKSFFPDSWALEPGAEAELLYAGGNEIAGVRFGKNVVLGVALDSIADEAGRQSILNGWITRAVTTIPVDFPDAGSPDTGPDAGMVDTGEPNPDGGVVDPDGGLDQDGGTPLSPRLRAIAERPITGGCGCQIDHRSSSSAGLGLLVFALLLARRRRV